MRTPDTDAIPALSLVQTTVATPAQAEQLAAALVEARLAACVQTTPIRSLYRWKGKVEAADEHGVCAKTRAALADRTVAFIRRRHPYEVPEILVTPVTACSADYARWVGEETAAPTDAPC